MHILENHFADKTTYVWRAGPKGSPVFVMNGCTLFTYKRRSEVYDEHDVTKSQKRLVRQARADLKEVDDNESSLNAMSQEQLTAFMDNMKHEVYNIICDWADVEIMLTDLINQCYAHDNIEGANHVLDTIAVELHGSYSPWYDDLVDSERHRGFFNTFTVSAEVAERLCQQRINDWDDNKVPSYEYMAILMRSSEAVNQQIQAEQPALWLNVALKSNWPVELNESITSKVVAGFITDSNWYLSHRDVANVIWSMYVLVDMCDRDLLLDSFNSLGVNLTPHVSRQSLQENKEAGFYFLEKVNSTNIMLVA